MSRNSVPDGGGAGKPPSSGQRTATAGTPAVLDCRGVEITAGCKVVISGASNHLHERTVKRIESKPGWWIDVRFTNGGWTTPERCAVVQ